MREPLCGLFVGGKARRMGGVAKGLLPAPDSGEPLVQRLRQKAELLGLRCVLVGQAAAYGGLGLPMLADEPPGIGPLGGLRALLGAADGAWVLALACDLPYVSGELLRRLREAPDSAGSQPPYDAIAAPPARLVGAAVCALRPYGATDSGYRAGGWGALVSGALPAAPLVRAAAQRRRSGAACRLGHAGGCSAPESSEPTAVKAPRATPRRAAPRHATSCRITIIPKHRYSAGFLR